MLIFWYVEGVLMKNQAILTLLIDKKEVLKVTPSQLTPRGCEFKCSEKEVTLFRDKVDHLTQGRYANFNIRLGLFPHSGPVPQYITAEGQVISIRRNAQDCYCIALEFEHVAAGGYRLIAEHLSDSVVTSIDLIKSKIA